jgi:hypothetical protein
MNRYDLREDIAEMVYEAFPFVPELGVPQKPAWVRNGNSFMQDDARRAASNIMARLRDEPGFVRRLREESPELFEAVKEV